MVAYGKPPVMLRVGVFKVSSSFDRLPDYHHPHRIGLSMTIMPLHSPISIAATFVASTAVYIFVSWIMQYLRLRRSNPTGFPYPPGPKGLPLVGSLLEMHKDQEWLTYHDWFRKYGECYSFLEHFNCMHLIVGRDV
jgi:hypothetical protein